MFFCWCGFLCGEGIRRRGCLGRSPAACVLLVYGLQLVRLLWVCLLLWWVVLLLWLLETFQGVGLLGLQLVDRGTGKTSARVPSIGRSPAALRALALFLYIRLHEYQTNHKAIKPFSSS